MVEGETSHNFDVQGGWWRKRNTIMSLHGAKGERVLKQRVWSILTVKICGREGPSPAGSSAGERLPQQ